MVKGQRSKVEGRRSRVLPVAICTCRYVLPLVVGFSLRGTASAVHAEASLSAPQNQYSATRESMGGMGKQQLARAGGGRARANEVSHATRR